MEKDVLMSLSVHPWFINSALMNSKIKFGTTKFTLYTSNKHNTVSKESLQSYNKLNI
jgi:hypothetical protein